MFTWNQLVFSCIIVFLITVGIMSFFSRPMSVCVRKA